MRTKAFVQDDAHILCMAEQVEGEVKKFCILLRQIYADFGFPDFKVALSTRPALRAGSDEVWDEAEAALGAAARAAGLEFAVQPGEGAFYGPKLEFHLTDKQDRDWQCGTIQLDMVLPGRLNAGYISADNQREVPVMIHHAVLGSVERFIGILLEHYEGWLPLWLAPEQVVVANVSDASADYAADVAAALRAAGIHVSEDFRAERLPRKIIDARERFLPVFLAVGERDRREGTVSLRWRDGSQEVLKLEHGIARLRAAVRSPVGA
jgi:threonyl-tRNA synthetase